MLITNRENLDRLSNGFPFSSNQKDLFTKYVELFEEWNQHTNLVSTRDVEKIVSRHIFESLQVLRLDSIANAARIIDLGSGGGFPGIPLAIMEADKKVFLVESRKRKSLFLQQVKESLPLVNVDVFCDRVENLSRNSLGGPVDVVVARAVADLSKLWKWSVPLLSKKGCMIVFKGGNISQEKKNLPATVKCEQLPIPAIPEQEQRCFVRVWSKTDKR